MKTLTAPIIAIAAIAIIASAASAEEATKAKTIAGTLVLYKGQDFSGQSYRIAKEDPQLQHEFLVGSMVSFPGEKWEVCDKPKYKGNCNIIEGEVTEMGRALIKSARPVG